MMTVRFPTGFSIQYNDANWVKTLDKYYDLYAGEPSKDDSRWVARVPLDCAIEIQRACRVYDARTDPRELGDAFLAQLRSISSSTLAAVKRELRSFDIRSYHWR